MFVHLRLHTEFSVTDGTVRIDDAVSAAAGDGQPALGVTDLNNLFGAVKFYKAARGAGVKPVLGAEVTLQGFSEEASGAMPGAHQPALTMKNTTETSAYSALQYTSASRKSKVVPSGR